MSGGLSYLLEHLCRFQRARRYFKSVDKLASALKKTLTKTLIYSSTNLIAAAQVKSGFALISTRNPNECTCLGLYESIFFSSNF